MKRFLIMQNTSQLYKKKVKAFGLLIAFCFLFSTQVLAQFIDPFKVEVNGDELLITSVRGDNYCVRYGHKANNVVVWINGDHRYSSGFGGSASVITFPVSLKSNEFAREIDVHLAIYQDACLGDDRVIFSKIKKVYVPYYQDLGNGVSITAHNIPDGPCGAEIISHSGGGLLDRTSVKSRIYDQQGNSFVVPKENKAYNFTFDFGSRGYSRVRFSSGGYLKEGGFKWEGGQDLRINGSKADFSYQPATLYLNEYANYTRLLIVECYQGSSLRQTVYIPIIVTGNQVKLATDASGNPLKTTSAPILNTVLHNIPGDASSTFLATSTTTCNEVSMGFSRDNHQAAGVTVTLGTDVSVFGVNIETEFSVTGSFSRSVVQGRESSTEVCTTIERVIENLNSPGGVEGDLFIGSYTTYIYGPSVEVSYNNCQTRLNKKNLHFVPVAIEDFNFQKRDIETDVIPNLERLKRGIEESVGNDATKYEKSEEWRKLKRNIAAWRHMLNQNDQNVAQAPILQTKSLKGGRGEDSQSIGVERTNSYSISSSLIIDASVAIDAGVSVGGSGFSASTEIGVATEVSKGRSGSQTDTRTTGYNLQDDDGEDELIIKIKKDRMFGTPIFELDENDARTRTSCPYEGGYQLNQPKLLVLDENGTERKTTDIYAPLGAAAQIPLRIINTSNYARSYRLQIKNAANAKIKYGSKEIGLSNEYEDIGLAANQTMTLTGSGIDLLYVEQNTSSQGRSYEGIEITLSPICEEDAEDNDMVTLNVYFEERENCGASDRDADGLGDACDNCPDQPNVALSFDGRDDRVNSAGPLGISSGNSAHTLEAWVYLNQLPAQRCWVSHLGQFNLGGHHWLIRSDGKMQIGAFGNPQQLTPSIQVGKWTHFAAVSDGRTLTLYIDGIKFGSAPASFNFASKQLHLSRPWNGENYFNGKLDEVRVWNVARSRQAIRDNMKEELAGDEAGLVAYYNFNQGVVQADNAGLNSLKDQTANNHDGVLEGFALNGATSNWTTGAPVQFLDADGNGIGDHCDEPVGPPCQLQDAGLVVSACDDNGTIDFSDDFYTLSLQPSGTSLSSSYSVQSQHLTATNLPYNAITSRRLLVGAGQFPLVITDSENSNCQITATVTPPLCIQIDQEFLNVSPENQNVGGDGFGGIRFSVSSNANWSVSSDAGWLSFTPRQGSDDGSFFAEYTKNTTSASRVATITVRTEGGITVQRTITQGAGTTVPNLSVDPQDPSVDKDAGLLSFNVTTSANVAWEANADPAADWLTLLSPQGEGSGSFNVFYQANNGGASRSATITVAAGGQSTTTTITQEANVTAPNLSVDPQDPEVNKDAGLLTFNVTTSANIAWEASADPAANWLTLLSPQGEGSGSFNVFYQANNGGASRSATITILGDGESITTTITQEAGATANGPDYIVESLQFADGTNPNGIQPGNKFKMEGKIKNVGSLGFNSQTRAFYYLSTDNQLDNFDLYLTRDHIDPLNPNAVNTDEEFVTIPANTAPGVYYLLYRADAMTQIDETNENNNVGVQQITVVNGNNVSVLCDNFNGYTNGGIAFQSSNWVKWADHSLDAEVTSSWSSDAGKSLKVLHDARLSDQPDVLLKLGDRTNGTYYLSWKMYVPVGKTAYFNMQENQNTPGTSKFQITFNNQGVAELRVGGNFRKQYDYPQDQWFDMSLLYMLDDDKVIVSLNGTRYELRSSWRLGAIDFYAVNNAEYYVDEFCMVEIGRTQMAKARSTNVVVEATTDKNPSLKSGARLISDAQATIPSQIEATLGQNYPNPVSVSTTIPVVVPTGAQDAFIQITGMNGRVLNRIPVGDRGDVRLEIPTQNLAAGIYMYSLIVDGELIGSKRMSVVGNR